MAELFQFELVSPERQLLSEQVLEVIVPGAEGEFGVLKDHSPFMSTIQAGILKVRRDQAGTMDEYFVRGGFADVATGGLTVLAEQAIPVSDLKIEHLDEQIKNAEEDVADARESEALRKAQDTLARLTDIRESLRKI